MSSTAQFWIEIVIYQITSGSISFAASTMIVTYIAINGLSTPYRRIIFGLSVSDMCQSFAILTGPFLAPSDVPQALWAIGNKHTCRLDGFLYCLGMTAVPMYTVFLCVYYVCKLKNKMSDAQFSERLEKKWHVGIIAINFGLYLTALGMNALNSVFMGNYCATSSVPAGCRRDPELYGECDESIELPRRIFVFIGLVLVPISSLIAIIICMGMIFWHILIRERIFGTRNSTRSKTSTSSTHDIAGSHRYLRSSRNIPVESSTGQSTSYQCVSGIIDNGEGLTTSSADNQNPSPQDDNDIGGSEGVVVRTLDLDAETLSRIFKKELLSQVCGYVMVFCLTTLPFIVLMLKSRGEIPEKHYLRVVSILHPLAGLFNIIVYTRWNVRSYRRRHPECSRLRAFWLVLKAGGDLPHENAPKAGGDLANNEGEGMENSAQASSNQFDVAAQETISELNAFSGAAMILDNASSIDEDDVRYTSESEWARWKGGARSASVAKPTNVDALSTATTIHHANRGERSEISSVDVGISGLKFDSELGAAASSSSLG